MLFHSSGALASLLATKCDRQTMPYAIATDIATVYIFGERLWPFPDQLFYHFFRYILFGSIVRGCMFLFRIFDLLDFAISEGVFVFIPYIEVNI